MQTVSAAFTTACTAVGQRAITYLEIVWDDSDPDPLSYGRGVAPWTNETPYLISHDGNLSIAPPGEQLVAAGDIGRLSVELGNTDGRFSWRNILSPIYNYINGAAGLVGKPVRLWQGWRVPGSEYVCIFTGVIAAWEEDVMGMTVTLEVRDWGHRYLQNKASTTLYTDRRVDEWTAIMAAAAGITYTSLDVGIYPIPFVWMDDESYVSEIWDTWAADGGIAYFDQLGVLRGENVLHWLSGPHATSQWLFDEGEYQLVSASIDADALATKVIVEWSGRTIAPIVALYELDRYKLIMPGQTETWTARYQQATSQIATPDPNPPFSDYYAQTMGGANMTASLTLVISNAYAQQCTVSVTNNSTIQAARLTFLRIRGYPLLGGPTEQEEVVVSPAPLQYERVRSYRGNPYVQLQAQGRALADMAAVRCSVNRPVYNVDGVMAVPQLELGDRVTLRNLRAFGGDRNTTNDVDGLVLGIRWQGSAQDGFVQSLSIMDLSALALYNNYFIIGVDTLGGYKRTYY